MVMDPKARHKARILAMQAMYQWQMTGHDIAELETQYRTRNQTQHIDWPFFVQLVHGVPKKISALDASISPYLDRPIKDVTPVELSILRLASFELIDVDDIPFKVILNEYINLAKRYGGVEAHKFINGVLDQLAKKIRPDAKSK